MRLMKGLWSFVATKSKVSSAICFRCMTIVVHISASIYRLHWADEELLQ